MDFRVRQKSSDSRGWLRFQGPVLGRPESQIWAGVQWDIDSGKGKHDGEVNGHRYFTCPSGTGSLVKLSKIEFPITLEQALQEKYGETFDGLKYAGLQGSNVGILNVSKEISMLEGVDLSNSLICSWKDILSFLFSMPFLVEIDLSRNILDSSSVSSSEALLNDNGCVTLPLKKLFLNKTTCSTEFLKLALKFGILPELELLHLRGNKLNSESKLPVSFPNLQELDLSYNEIDDMASILPLSKLKTLNILRLNNNKITRISIDQESPCEFQSLCVLDLSGNPIDRFSFIEAFSLFQRQCIPQLTTLGLADLSITQNIGVKLLRSKIIPLFPSVKQLNRSEISIKERNDCELRYLNECIATNNLDKPRVDELLKQFRGMTPSDMRREISEQSQEKTLSGTYSHAIRMLAYFPNFVLEFVF